MPADGRRYAVEDLTIRYAPSLHAALATQGRAAAMTGSSLLTVVDEALPHAQAEVDGVRSYFTPADAGPAFSSQRAEHDELVSTLGGVSIAHFACHGAADGEQALNSAILACRDRAVTLADILGQHFTGMRLVTLSACESALSDRNLPDEMINLPSGLIQAGAAGRDRLAVASRRRDHCGAHAAFLLGMADQETTACLCPALGADLAARSGAAPGHRARPPGAGRRRRAKPPLVLGAIPVRRRASGREALVHAIGQLPPLRPDQRPRRPGRPCRGSCRTASSRSLSGVPQPVLASQPGRAASAVPPAGASAPAGPRTVYRSEVMPQGRPSAWLKRASRPAHMHAAAPGPATLTQPPFA